MPIMTFPSPDTRHPLKGADGTPQDGTVFLKTAIDHPRIKVGTYTYASAFDPPADWAARLAHYTFDFSPERLIIGKFCQIAVGVTFITASANHRFDGGSSYPFGIFTGDHSGPSMPTAGPDTIIGSDVWIGQGARILPGAQIGDGVIIGAVAVVAGQVPPYSIAAGNPARVVRRRFDDATIARLCELPWWNRPIEHIVASEAAISRGDIAAFDAAAKEV